MLNLVSLIKLWRELNLKYELRVSMEIRPANENDVAELAELMSQLGYSTTTEEMENRFRKIDKDADYYTLVAEVEDKVVGMVGLRKGYFYERNEVSVRIVAFVVDEDYRKLGIGKQLMKVAENWAREQGAYGIGLTSGKRKEREAAHDFYKRLGYEDNSIGFVKVF